MIPSGHETSDRTAGREGPQRQGLNLLKFLCAVCVVGAHCPTPWVNSFPEFFHILPPLFFMITGFFCCEADGRLSPARCLKMVRRSGLYVVVLNLLYILFLLIYRHFTGEPHLFSHMLTREFLADWIRYGHNVHFTLWYLTALFWSALFLYISARLRLRRLFPLIFLGGLLIGLSRGTYHFLLHDEPFRWITYTNAKTVGIPCIILGVWMRRAEASVRFRRIFPAAASATAVLAAAEIAALRHILPAPDAGYLYLTAPLIDCTVFYIFLVHIRPAHDLRFLSRRARDIYLFQGMAIICVASARSLWTEHSIHFMPLAVAALLYLMSAAGETIHATAGRLRREPRKTPEPI